jgi:hypothetical protein
MEGRWLSTELIETFRYCEATGKISWKKLSHAKRAATMTNRSPIRPDNSVTVPFQCHNCGYWHIGRRRPTLLKVE